MPSLAIKYVSGCWSDAKHSIPSTKRGRENHDEWAAESRGETDQCTEPPAEIKIQLPEPENGLILVIGTVVYREQDGRNGTTKTVPRITMFNFI